MKRFTLTLAALSLAAVLTAPAMAQAPTLHFDTDQLFVDAGSEVVLEIELSTTTPIAALQFEVQTNNSQDVLSWSTPLQNKSLRCSGKRCILAGLNAEPITPGVIAETKYTVTRDTSFTFGNLIGASPEAQRVEIITGQIIRIAVYSPYDLDRDGQLTIADFDLSINRALASADLSYTVVNVQELALQIPG